MIDKIITAEKAVEGIQDGMTVMIGGFLGTGTPEILIDALVAKGVKHLTAACRKAHMTQRRPAVSASSWKRA